MRRPFSSKPPKRRSQARGLTAREVDTIVTVSSTGIATPSLEARAFRHMGFATISCACLLRPRLRGGVSGLSIAARLAEARPGSTVLLVAVELCTLAFRLDEFTKAFSALNAAVLAVRIKAEDEALARRGGVGASSG